MGRFVNPDNSAFQVALNSEIYIDKSGMIEIIAEKNGMKYAVQCKHYSSNVGNHAVQEAFSGKSIYNADVAVVMFYSNNVKNSIEFVYNKFQKLY